MPKAPLESLARGLSGSEEGCPFPSTHDKLGEAHYFLHQLIEHYHHSHPFRYSLSAFLQANRSVTLILQVEIASADAAAKAWYEAKQDAMKADADLVSLRSLRTEVAHRAALVPASTVFVGHMQYGRPKGGLRMPFDPMVDSMTALLRARDAPSGVFGVHPHRAWSGEEFGVERVWPLPCLAGRELVGVCLAGWQKIADIVAEAHTMRGFGFGPSATCHAELGEAMILRESDLFPEVADAWEREPNAEVWPIGESLALLAAPDETGQIRHRLKKIRPKQRRTLPISVRFPPDLYEEVTAYAKRLGAGRTYVIVECVRQTLDADREWKREWKKRTG